jgi:hypothetical protein
MAIDERKEPDSLDVILDQLFNERESYIALRDMYPRAHPQIEAAVANQTALKLRLISVAIADERKRCYDIVMAVRFGEIEQDLRSVLSFIERGDSVEDLKKWSGRG